MEYRNCQERYLFMRGLIQHERSQRSRHYLKQAAECTSKAIVSLELAEQPVKTVKQARKLEAIGGETCIRLTKLESERNFSSIRPMGGRFVSSAGGILVAMADLTQEIYNGGHSLDKPVLILEKRVKERASLYTEESIQENNHEVFCPAWWRLEVLIKRGFIKRRSQKKLPVLQLLPLGKQVAQQLRDRNGLQAPTASIKLPELPFEDSKTDVGLENLIETLDSTAKTPVEREDTLTAEAIQERSLYTNDDGLDGLILLVDTQEMGGQRVGLGEVCQLLGNRGVRYRTQKLKVADYSWVWRCSNQEVVMPWLVERKRADDLAETLKEGRFWTQVSKMLEWKGQFSEAGVDVKLYYLLERKPEEYMVRCTDGCQGIGKCGNPTLTQLKLVVEDLRQHPQLLARQSDSLETSVLFLASLTEELKECITAGEFDSLLQQGLKEDSRGKSELTPDQSRDRASAECINTSSRHKKTDNEEVETPVFMAKQEPNVLEPDRMATLSYEEQVQLAIQMSLKEEKDKTPAGKPASDKSWKAYSLGFDLETEKQNGDRFVKNLNDMSFKTNISINSDDSIEDKVDSTLGRRHMTSAQCRNNNVYYQDIDYEREDRDLEVAIHTSKQCPIKATSVTNETDREEKELQLAIERSKQDITSQSFQNDEIKSVGLGVGRLCEEMSHPLMQYHCSEGGSVIYPHQTGRKTPTLDQNSYRPKMNRKRVIHTPVKNAIATITTDSVTKFSDNKCDTESSHTKTLNTSCRDGVPSLNTSTCRTSDMSRIESKKVLSAYENHRHLEPSCRNVTSGLSSPWQSEKSDNNNSGFPGRIFHERNNNRVCETDFTHKNINFNESDKVHNTVGCKSISPRKSVKKSTGVKSLVVPDSSLVSVCQKNSDSTRNKLNDKTYVNSTRKREQLSLTPFDCDSSKANKSYVRADTGTGKSRCDVDIKEDTTIDDTNTLSSASKPKRKKLNFSPSPSFTETNAVSVKYKSGRRGRGSNSGKCSTVVKVETETCNTDGSIPVNMSDNFEKSVPTVDDVENFETMCQKDSTVTKSLLQDNLTDDSTVGNCVANTVDSDEDLFPDLEDKVADVIGHSEYQSDLRRQMNEEDNFSLAQSRKAESAYENHRHFQPFCSESRDTYEQEEKVNKVSEMINSSSDDSNLSLPDLNNQSPKTSGEHEKYVKKNQSAESTVGNIYERNFGKQESEGDTIHKSDTLDIHKKHTLPLDNDHIHESTSGTTVSNTLNDGDLLCTDSNKNTVTKLSKMEESISTVMAVLPHVSASAVRSTLKTCHGNVELCVSVLLEAGSDA